MDKYKQLKKIISLCLVCSVLLLSVKLCKVETKAEVIAVTGVTTVTVIILGVLSVCGVLYLNQDTIATGINGYLDSVYTDYDEYNVTNEQSALNSVFAANNVNTKVMDDEVYDEFAEEYSDSIIYHITTKNGRNLAVYQCGSGGTPEPSQFDFKPMATFAVGMGTLFTVCKSVVNYYSRFFDKVNNSMTINNNIDLTEDIQGYFSRWGENFVRVYRYSEYESWSNGDIAVRAYFNSGSFDLIYNRPYSTASNNMSYFFYAEGTTYQLTNGNSNVAVRSYKDWTNHSVRGNCYSNIKLGCTDANINGESVLVPYLDFGFEKVPFSFDEDSPYYCKGVYIFGDYYDFTNLINPEDMPDEWVAPDNLELGESNALENLPDDFNFEQFKHYLDNKFPVDVPTASDDKIQVTTPELGELPNTLEYPLIVISSLGVNPNYNPDVSPSPAPSPSEVPLPDDIPIQTDNEDLNNLQLGGFMNKFPFCIPQDVYNILHVFVAEPQAPVFRLSLPTPMFEKKSQDFVLDFQPFDSLAALLRRIELVGFCLGLALITRDLIKG